MRCESCNASAPTRNVTFYQNIGLLFIRYPSSVEGEMCKRCIHRFFWKMTLTSLVAGWWGIISFFMNIYFILNNIAQYASCLTMSAVSPAPPPKPPRPGLHPFSEERIDRFKQDIQAMLTAGEEPKTIHEQISDKAMVPPDQVAIYVQKHFA